jgi:hypothetical protein
MSLRKSKIDASIPGFSTNSRSTLSRSTDLAAIGSGSPVLGAGRDNLRDSLYALDPAGIIM